jgi:uncharacterized RDD family membrane protein YckC
MKCPDCNFVCSDLRDICPKCFVDLREFKTELGIPVTNPKASYEQLLERTGAARTALRGIVDPSPTKSNLWGAVAGLFGAKTSGGNQKTTGEELESLSLKVERPLPTPREAPQAETNLPSSKSESTAIQRQIETLQSEDLSRSPLLEPKIMDDNKKLEYQFNIDIPPLIPAQVPSESASGPAEIPEPPSFNDGARAALESRLIADALEGAAAERDLFSADEQTPVQESAEVQAPTETLLGQQATTVEGEGLTESLALIEEPLPSQNQEVLKGSSSVLESPPPSASSSTPAPTPLSFELKPSGQTLGPTLDALFAETLGDLINTRAEDAIELSSEHFYSNVQPERVAVLFEMTREALIDPESERRYTDEIETSSQRKVESEEMTAQLRNVVQVMNAPMVTLKGRQGLGLSGKSIERETPEHWEPAPVSVLRRLAAMLVDTLVVLFLTVLGTSALLVYLMPDFDAVLLGDRIPNIFDIINVITYAALSGILLSIFLPTLFLSLWSSTPGLSAMGLTALSLKGKSVGKAQALVRSAVMPLSLLFFGWVPLLFGKGSLHDSAARIVIARKRDRREA